MQGILPYYLNDIVQQRSIQSLTVMECKNDFRSGMKADVITENLKIVIQSSARLFCVRQASGPLALEDKPVRALTYRPPRWSKQHP